MLRRGECAALDPVASVVLHGVDAAMLMAGLEHVPCSMRAIPVRLPRPGDCQ